MNASGKPLSLSVALFLIVIAMVPVSIVLTSAQPHPNSDSSLAIPSAYHGSFQNWWDTQPLPPLPEPMKQSFLEYIHRDFGVDGPQSFRFTATQLADGTIRSVIEIDGMVIPVDTTVAYTYYPRTDRSQPPQIRQQWSLLVTTDGIPYGEIDIWYTPEGEIDLSHSRLALIPQNDQATPAPPLCFDYHMASHPFTGKCPIYAFADVAQILLGSDEQLISRDLLQHDRLQQPNVLLELFAQDATANEDADFVLNFTEGWNLFSVPTLLEEDDVSTLFGDLSVDAILVYVDGDWQPVCGECEITTIEPLFAYWVNVNEEAAIPLYFKDPPVPIPPRLLNAGWDFVGITSTYPTESELLLASIEGHYSQADVWSEGTWITHLPGQEPDVLADPGGAMWVFMESGATLEAFQCKPVGDVCSLHNGCCGQVCTDGLCGAPDIEVTPASLEFVI